MTSPELQMTSDLDALNVGDCVLYAKASGTKYGRITEHRRFSDGAPGYIINGGEWITPLMIIEKFTGYAGDPNDVEAVAEFLLA